MTCAWQRAAETAKAKYSLEGNTERIIGAFRAAMN
jgi:hypothetical protein